MPRIRSLKYEYFINEDLAQTSLQARLLGLGLTTLADREGRLEDRPLRIKVMLFPYDDVRVDDALNELQSVGFLQRYIVNNQRFIRIVNFLKHQKPHPKEAASSIPGHEKVRTSREKTRQGKPRESGDAVQGEPSKVGNGLGGFGSSVNGNGSGHGDSGERSSAEAGASATRQQDFDIWKLGVGKLVATGTDERDARNFLGKMRSDYGDDVLSEGITKMLAKNPVDPRAYLVAILQGRAKGKSPPPTKVEGSLAAAQRVAEKYEQQN